MADFKSCEGAIFYCPSCKKEIVIEFTDHRTDSRSCYCGDHLIIIKPIEIRLSNNNRKKFGQLTVDVDVSDALTGLKAVQKEARKTTQALKEVEELSLKLKE